MFEPTAGARMDGALPSKLADLVQYQEGSVVSRILYQHAAGTLTVFAFAQGQALSEHTVPFEAFIQILDGTARITIGGTVCVVAQGELVRMPGGVPHQVDADERFKMLLTLFRAPPV